MLQNNIVNVDEFIRLTNAGMKIATFTQIRSALIDRYKAIYGSDIDLSTGSADGIFVNDLALIINNILQSVNTMYANLDVENASGVYLDTLCALSNITRKSATNSNVYINVTYSGSSEVTYSPQELIFVDKAGLEWYMEKNNTFQPGQTLSIKVICSQEGPTQAPVGWIYQVIDGSLPITVSQTRAANLGEVVESDAALRARRAQSSGAAGVTTTSALAGALLEVVGIKDVKVFNNNTDTDQTLSDGTALDKHSVYVVIRLDDGVNVPDETVGSIIYEKLTPGIYSCDTGDTEGISKSYNYIAEVNDIHQTMFNQMVYWKEAQPINPQITISIKPYSYFSTNEFDTITSSIMNYTNELLLDTPITENDLLIQTIYADPQFRGKATYATLSASSSDYDNDIRYYNYNRYKVACTGTVTQGTHEYQIVDAEFTISDNTFSLYNNCVIDENNVKYDLVNNTFTYNNLVYTVSDIDYTLTDDESGDYYTIYIEG